VAIKKEGGIVMKNLVVLTGAGMSAESGISTFRDAGGLWDKYPVEQVATPEGYPRFGFTSNNCFRRSL
jgi:NAD-dependent deacetylase